MFKSQIIQIFRRYEGNKVDFSQKHEKESKEIDRIVNEILKKFGNDSQLKSLLVDLQNATCDLNYADVEDSFKEAFVFGAQLALEICGAPCEDE